MGDEKNIHAMTREEFRALPHRKWDEDIGGFDRLVIVPADDGAELHDSGYRLMDFAAVRDGKAICLLSGCSDVLHIGGVGGSLTERPRRARAWSIDCLPTSGFLCLFDSVSRASGSMTSGSALSSFDIHSIGLDDSGDVMPPVRRWKAP